ncbi:MAG: four helix bundle protein [Deltaproteobacteria bacterium]|nr:four helix bundle protein [Deltaproteobacteria bacterium]
MAGTLTLKGDHDFFKYLDHANTYERYQYIRSLYIAYGSNCELETQMLLSGDLGYIERVKLDGVIKKIQEVERMHKALIESFESNPWPLSPN